MILIHASILRIWNLFQIPFTHDEMSALVRTRFDRFQDLIELGVKPDTHPPGVQVFMYFWTHLFGEAEWIVKLPFIIMGIWSIYLAYTIFRKWSNETVALIVASLLSTLQFTVMYSQIARPYISGMFLILCLLYFWDRLIHSPEKRFWINFTLTGIFAAACAYNHHFSFLAAILIGLAGVFIIERKFLWKYLLLPVWVVILYLPNLPIFLQQLDRGGVGEWLGAPKPRFIIDFFSYVTNHSLLLIATLILIISIGIYSFKPLKNIPKMTFWSLGIFFSVWIVGYYYSIYINPVLQFSMLLFCFPLLLYGIFGWYPSVSKQANIWITLLILGAGTFSLAITRKHYSVFYQNRYFQMKEDAAACDMDQTCFIFATYPHFLSHPFPAHLVMPENYLAWEYNVNSIQSFEKYIESCDKPQLFLGIVEQFPKELIAIAQKYYPNLVEAKYCSGAASYLFSRETQNPSLVYFKNNVLDQANLNTTNGIFQQGTFTDSSEWSIGKELLIGPHVVHPYDIISVFANVKMSHETDTIILVCEILDGSNSLLYTGKSSCDYLINSENKTVTIFNSFNYNSISTLKNSSEYKLKTYLWNVSQHKIEVTDYQINILKGNRVKYSLYEAL